MNKEDAFMDRLKVVFDKGNWELMTQRDVCPPPPLDR